MGKKVGFVGCYSHDIILMLAKGMRSLGKRVLITDRNVRQTLSASVPVPEGLSARKETVEYDGVFFSEQRNEEQEADAYDVELTDYGFLVSGENIGKDTVCIKRLVSTCSCAVAVCEDKVLLPGEKSEVVVRYDPKGHPGRFYADLRRCI